MMDLQNQITFGEQNRMQNCMSDIFKKMSYPSKWQCWVHKTMPQQTSKHVSTKICQGKKCLNFVKNIDSPDMQFENRFQGLHAESSRITWTDQKLDTLTENILPWLDLHVEILTFLHGDKDLWWVRYVVCIRHGDILFLAQTYTVHLSICIVFPPLLFFRLWPPPTSNELILHGCGPGLPYCSNSWNKLTNENIK